MFPTVPKIKYHLAFAIPAFVVLFGVALAVVGALLTVLFNKHNIQAMRHQLQKLSPSRSFTTFLRPELRGMTVSSTQWSRTLGKLTIDITGDYPVSARSPEEVVTEGKEGPSVVNTSMWEGSMESEQFLGEQHVPVPAPYSRVRS